MIREKIIYHGMNISWGIATLSGMRSKDPNTQVGACIVSQDNKILSMGYNGLPEAVQMMSFHGTEMVKIISISIQLIVSLMRFLITEAEALIMPSFM